MYKFDDVLQTTKKSTGNNSIEYIILHHTWGWSYKSNCRVLSWDNWQVSCHFVIWPCWKAAKIWEPKDIQRHVWVSEWGNKENMNRYSIWIEVVWPDDKWLFSDCQYNKVVDLVKYLMKAFNIPKENVLKHSDLTWAGSPKKELWDWKSKTRKVDIAPTLWNKRWFNNFAEWREKVL